MRRKFKERAKQPPEKHTISGHPTKVVRRPFSQQISSTTAETLHEEELTGGLPMEAQSQYCENVMSKQVEAKSIAKSESEEFPCLDPKESRAFSRSEEETKEADASMSLGCEINIHVQSDRCLLEEEEQKSRIIHQTIAKDENFIDVNLNKEELKSQNDHFNGKGEREELFFETQTKPSTTGTDNAIDARKKNNHRKNEEYASFDDKHDIAHDEKAIATQQFNDEKDLNSSRSVTFRSRSARHEMVDEITAWNVGKSEETKKTDTNDLSVSQIASPPCENVQLMIQQESDPITTAEVRIKIRLSGTEESATDETKNVPMGSLSKKKEQQYGISEKRRLSNDVLVVDPCNVYKIIECMKDETSKQSLATKTTSTITPNILKKKETNRNELVCT